MKKKIGLLLILFTFLGIGCFIYFNPSEFTRLFNLGFFQLAPILTTSLIYIVLQAVIFQYVLTGYNTKLTLNESFGTFILTLAGNYLIPFAGLGFRAGYLKVVHNFELKNFSMGILVIYFTELFVFAIGGMLGLYFTSPFHNDFVQFLMFGLALGVLLLTVMFCTDIRYPINWPCSNQIGLIFSAWSKIRNNYRLVITVLFMQVLLFMIYSHMFHLCFESLEIHQEYLRSFVFSMFNDFSFFIRFTPAGIGVFEASIAYPAYLFGLSMSIALMITVLMRGAVLFWIMLFSPYYIYTLGARLSAKRSIKPSEDNSADHH